MAGSGRPESKQVKKLGSDSSQMNVPYFNQQSAPAQAGPTKRHPLAPTKIVSNEQQQPVADAAGA
jgi:hypothetical protein